MENFQLTNEQRKYFGLNPIESSWERVQWLDTSYIFFDGNTIRKIIHYDPHPNFHTGYIERDYELQTENQAYIKPKTARGKLKKVTASNILALKPVNVSFEWTCRGIYVDCQSNDINIAKGSAGDFEQLEEWVKNYIASALEDYSEQLQRIRRTPKLKKNNTYRAGDIFCYQVEKNKFCFGQILLDLWKLNKCGKFPEEKYLSKVGRFRLFGNPLIVRGFDFFYDNPNPDLAEILQHASLGGFYAVDWMIYDNGCPIIGNSPIKEKDMLFPMMILRSDAEHYIFQWGFIEKQIEITPLMPLIEKTNYEVGSVGNNVYRSAIITPEEKNFHMKTDLNHTDNRELKREVFKIINASMDVTYNQFAQIENELTIEQIFESI